MVTDVTNSSGSEDHQHQKCQIQNYQNKDSFSVGLCRIPLLHHKQTRPYKTKSSTN